MELLSVVVGVAKDDSTYLLTRHSAIYCVKLLARRLTNKYHPPLTQVCTSYCTALYGHDHIISFKKPHSFDILVHRLTHVHVHDTMYIYVYVCTCTYILLGKTTSLQILVSHRLCKMCCLFFPALHLSLQNSLAAAC